MIEEKNYSVYVHINKNDDNKAYVGISKNVKKRWANGNGYKGQDKFYNAIKKYGWNNFNHIILIKNLSLKDAWEKEKKFIKRYDSINDGYNVHEGGEITLTKEMREKGYITKKLKHSGLTITSIKTLKTIRYDSVEEASLRTGISEHWFYKYYKMEVECLENYILKFDIEYDCAGKAFKKIEQNKKMSSFVKKNMLKWYY